MIKSQKAKFTATLTGIASFYATELTQMSLAIYWASLREHGLVVIQDAIQSHIKDPVHGRFMPKPADIIRHIPVNPNRQVVGADTAWEMAMRLNIGDEDATIVAPAAIMEAFPHALWKAGDKIAARMAFKDAYPSALATYGMSYIVSLGNNAAGREPVIMEAVKNNLITSEVALQVLPHLTRENAALEPPGKIPMIGNTS